MKRIRQFWINLSTREQRILAIGGVVAALIVVYTLLWAPWQDALQRLRSQVPSKYATLSWMREQAREIKPLMASQKDKKEDDVPLLTVVERTAESAKTRNVIRRMAPGDQENQVRIWLTEADFDSWLVWLEQLRKQGIEVVSATITRTNEDKVTIRVTLQRGV